MKRLLRFFNNLLIRISQKEYSHIIPLGFNCTLAYVLNKTQGYLESHLFNWCYIADSEKFIDCLKSNNEDIFVDGYEYLKESNMFKANKYQVVFHGKSRVSDIKNEDGNIDETIIQQEFIDLEGRNNYLNKKFHSLMSDDSNKLFVHILNPSIDSLTGIKFIKLLSEYLNSNFSNFDLLIICTRDQLKNYKHLKREISNLRIETVNVLPPIDDAINDQKIDIDSFTYIFTKYKLSRTLEYRKNKTYKFE